MKKSTLLRWLNMIGMGVSGAGALAWIGGIFGHKHEAKSLALIGEGRVLHPGLWVVACIASLFLLHRAARVRGAHFKHIIGYPPLPIAVILAFYIASAFSLYVEEGSAFFSPTLWEASVVAFCYMTVLGVPALLELIQPKTKERELRNGGGCDPKHELKRWIEKEQIVASKNHDRFEHINVSMRMLDWLRHSDATIALQGEFGSGKSSVCRMTETQARLDKLPLIFANVSCWGFESTAQAQRDVLETILGQVGKEVDCFAISHLPSDYVDAIGSQAGWLKTLLRMGTLGPLKQLRRLSPILDAIGKRLVIVIEDVDRSGQSINISQIQAMLMQFREVRGVSFILAISPTQQIDFVKLCDHLEVVPPLKRGDVLRLLHETREMLLEEHPPGIMLSKLEPLNLHDEDYSSLVRLTRYPWPWHLALSHLLNRPRLLKQALRRVHDGWPRLKGEVHFDDLVSISALRVGAPEVFMFLVENYEIAGGLENDERPALRELTTKLRDELVNKWKNICEAGHFEPKSAAALLSSICTNAKTITGIEASRSSGIQSMDSRKRGHIYARRLFTEKLGSAEQSDQSILSLIQHASQKQEARRSLAKILADSTEASEAFEEFAAPLEFKEDFALLSEVYAVIREKKWARLDRHLSPGFFAPRRRVSHQRGEGFENWLAGELVKCIPKHLRLLNDIYHFWLGAEDHTFEERKLPRQNVYDVIRATWTTSPAEIPAGFDPSHIHTLFHLIFTSGYGHPGSVPFGRIEEWEWSASPLYTACTTSPGIMFSQILLTLNKNTARGGEIIKYEFDTAALQKWFGGRVKSLLDLCLRRYSVPAELDAQSKAVLELALKEVEREHRLLNSRRREVGEVQTD